MIPVWPLLLLFSISSPIADATRSSLMKSNAVCSGQRVSIPSSSGAWLPLNHRHGPCSPSPSSERIPSTADVLLSGRLRADSIRRRLNGSAAAAERSDVVTVPTTLGTSLGNYEYVVTVGLGTPAVTQTVIMDTGSDVSWVQCRPCPVPAPCHVQKDPVFDPAGSATYSAFSCSSTACLGLGRRRAASNGCSGSSPCQYIVKYGAGSNSTGTYSSDKLTLTPAYAVDGFRFGCSHADPLFSDLTDGLIALGGGSLSLVSQMAEKAFSYCLPPTASHSGFLTLGVPRVSSSRFVVTPMHSIGNIKTYYGVLLQGITVAGRRLGIPPSVFAAGSVVDSGTVVTELPLTAYRALQAAFTKEMRMYPQVAPKNGFDTCFNLTTGGEVKLPSVALVFDRGATVELDPSGIIFDGCLAFASTGDDTSFGIIGNVQQRTFEVLYDIAGQAVGFRRGAC
ncbi:hypothetical protein SETIT_4G013500v2 [Setaria italica]|uniref:Peptidase A1 domain-containing protein n=1 Tax=Setaria italica TaxID=4555 RepID=K3XWV7_SETIT|nr:aspartyl protease family protein At5g10770 [Setaria italica]RCV19903.1 hypothetical protein SETIT_4G013500v2 [Setaria italica]